MFPALIAAPAFCGKNAVRQLGIALAILFAGDLCVRGEGSSGNEQENRSLHRTWHQYGGGADQSKFIDLTQITRTNVTELGLTWSFATRPAAQSGVPCMFNPIVVDGVMYLLGGAADCLVAVDAETGVELWARTNMTGIVRTGINYWESPDKQDRRLLFCMKEALYAIDAKTGETISTFGDHGSVSLKEGFDRDPSTVGRVQSTTPGAIYQNLIFLGSSPGENYFSMPGHLRAYDVRTGKLAWMFHTVPQPGEYGYDTWPKDAYKYIGGVNTWGEITVDEKNGIVFFPLGSPTYDYYGADRIGTGLFGDCLLALDAKTGKRLWHFQAVHHDLWDYDFCSAPQLISIQHEGKTIEAVAIAGKQGFLYVFNRLTGEPIWPIEERPVPASTMPQEQAWPTQPFPTAPPPFNRQNVTANDLNPSFSPEKRQQWIKRLDEAKTGLYHPLSDQYETISLPGAVGGANRGNTAAEPDKGIVYVIAQDFASVYKLRREVAIPSDAPGTTNSMPVTFAGDQPTRGKAAYALYCQSCHGTNLAGFGTFPPIVDAGKRIRFGDFKTQIITGKGQMPGNPYLDDGILNDLYVFIGGTNAISDDHISEIAGSGSRPAQQNPQDRRRRRPLHYPAGVVGPTNNYTTGYGMEYPDLLSPPWSSIVAYDLNQGTIKWRAPLGHDPKAPKIDGRNSGVPNGSQRKGMIVTSTGLVFSTCLDGKVHVYDSASGTELWSIQLPRSMDGLPAMYEVKGKQYLAVCCMGKVLDEKLAAKVPPGYLVFSLQPAAARNRTN